jgi:hypothetical protein
MINWFQKKSNANLFPYIKVVLTSGGHRRRQDVRLTQERHVIATSFNAR